MKVYKNSSENVEKNIKEKWKMIIAVIVIFIGAIVISRILYYMEIKSNSHIPQSEVLKQELEDNKK